MGRLIALLVLSAVAVGIALAIQRRRPDPPSVPSYRAPAQLDRADFAHPTTPVLLVLFASTTCNTCPLAWSVISEVVGEATAAGRSDLAAVRIDVEDDATLHTRYRIDGVPTTVITDPDGVVTATFFGPITSPELADALPAP